MGRPRPVGPTGACRKHQPERRPMAASQPSRPTLSVVIPLFNEEDVLPLLYERLTRALGGIESYEIVFVNDGSQDRTLALLREFAARDRRVIVLDLSRNFGQQA